MKKAKEAVTPVVKTPKKEVAKSARKEEITPKEKNAKTPSDKVSWDLSDFQSALFATESAVTFSVNEWYLLEFSPIQWYKDDMVEVWMGYSTQCRKEKCFL